MAKWAEEKARHLFNMVESGEDREIALTSIAATLKDAYRYGYKHGAEQSRHSTLSRLESPSEAVIEAVARLIAPPDEIVALSHVDAREVLTALAAVLAQTPAPGQEGE